MSHKLLLLLLLIIPIKGQRYRYICISTHHMVNITYIYIHGCWMNKIKYNRIKLMGAASIALSRFF